MGLLSLNQDHCHPLPQIQLCLSSNFLLANNIHLNLNMDLLSEIYNLAVWEKNKPFIIHIYLSLPTVAYMRSKLSTIRVSLEGSHVKPFCILSVASHCRWGIHVSPRTSDSFIAENYGPCFEAHGEEVPKVTIVWITSQYLQ